jgi:hypothetical protein
MEDRTLCWGHWMRPGRKTKDAVVSENFNPDKKGVEELKKRLKKISQKLNGDDDDVQKSAFEMLADMRAAYAGAGGRKKLLKLIKSDDKLLLAMVKELMKIEASLMSTELKNKEFGGGNTVTFVVLKGLHDEVPEIMGTDKTVDLAQVANAINPTAEKKIAYEAEMEGPKP